LANPNGFCETAPSLLVLIVSQVRFASFVHSTADNFVRLPLLTFLSGLLLFSALPVSAQAQTSSISGFVRDSESGETLLLANVRLKDTLIGAATNNSGYYTITGLPAGSYVVQISYIGYQQLEIDVTLGEDEQRRLDVDLPPLSLAVDEVVVTAEADTEEEQRRLGVNKMPTATIRQLPTILEPDVFRSLQLLPGVKSASDFSSGLYIRGGSPDQTLILLDRTTVYNPTHFFGVFSTFNPDAIKDVRLYKGGYGAEYGGRIGSVVDIYNKDGNRRTNEGSVSLGLLASRALIEGPHKKGSWMFAIRRSTVEPLLAFARNQDVEGIPDTFYFVDTNGKVNFDVNDDNRLSVSFYAGQDVVDVPIAESVSARLRYGNRTLSTNWTRLFSERLFSNFTITGSHYFSKPVFEFATTEVFQENDVWDYSVKGDFEYLPDSRRALKAGFWTGNYRFDFRSVFDGLEGLNLKTRAIYTNVFGEYIYRPTSDWTITTGLRGAYFSDGDYVRFEPRLAVERRLTDNLYAQLGAGRYHQFLTLVTNEAFSGLDTWLSAAENVEPAYGDQIVTGLKYASDRGYRIEWEGYYRTMRDLFSLNPFLPDVAGLDYDELFHVGEGYAVGSELFIQGQVGRFSGFAGYTLGLTERRFPTINENAYYPPKYDRTHDLNVTSTARITSKWEFTSVFTYATGQAYTRPASQYRLSNSPFEASQTEILVSPFNGARLPNYHRLDVGFTRKGSLFGAESELQLQVINVYSRRNVWFYFYESEEDGSFKRTTVPQIPVPIPNISFTLRF